MVSEHLFQNPVGHVALVVLDHLADIDILDGMVVGAEPERTAHGCKIRLGKGSPELVGFAHIATHCFKGGSDQHGIIIALACIQGRGPVVGFFKGSNKLFIGLIIIGGIGFSVIYELYTQAVSRTHRRRISLHTRLVLWTTGILLAAGAVSIFLVESGNALQGEPVFQKILASFFQSTTARTAGFNTVNMNALSNETLLILMVLMFIGASPGSCGGGIRTTSLAILVALFVNRIRGNTKVNIAGRTVPEETVNKMVSVILLGVLVIIANTMLLLATQSAEYLHPLKRDLFISYLFESVSALGTVGLSLGVTGTLNAVGKLLVVALMLIGRVGLITLAYGLFSERRKSPLEYASEDVML